MPVDSIEDRNEQGAGRCDLFLVPTRLPERDQEDREEEEGDEPVEQERGETKEYGIDELVQGRVIHRPELDRVPTPRVDPLQTLLLGQAGQGEGVTFLLGNQCPEL